MTAVKPKAFFTTTGPSQRVEAMWYGDQKSVEDIREWLEPQWIRVTDYFGSLEIEGTTIPRGYYVVQPYLGDIQGWEPGSFAAHFVWADTQMEIAI